MARMFKICIIIPVLLLIFIFGAYAAGFFRANISEKVAEIAAAVEEYARETRTAISDEIEKFLTEGDHHVR